MSLTEHPLPAVYAGTCPECGELHAETSAHLAPSKQYRATISARHGRRPTWGDAIEHLTGEARRYWEEVLADLRIDPEAEA